MSKMVIGLAGFARAGKDTAGDYLVKNYGFKKAPPLAAKIKQIVQDVWGFSDEQIWGPAKDLPDERYPFSGTCVVCGTSCGRDVQGHMFHCPSCGWFFNHRHITPRLTQQTLGTEWARRLYEDIWIDVGLRNIRESEHDRWVFCDVRFRNEVHGIQDAGGLVPFINRYPAPEHPHASETELLEMRRGGTFDAQIDNLGAKEEFYEQVDTFLYHTGIKAL